MNEEQARVRVRKFTARYRTKTEAAAEIGCLRSQLSDVLSGKSGVSARIADGVGLELVETTTRSYRERQQKEPRNA